jgi:hypothetical protein
MAGWGLDFFPLFQFLIAIQAQPARFRKMVLSMKAKIPGKLAFLPAQFLIGKLLKRSTAAAEHEPMAPFLALDGTLNKPTAGQNPMRKIQGAEQVERAIDSNMVYGLALLV